MRSIKRTHPTSDETPPWAGMSFIQPVDSDALHELLKNQYPQCTSLRQRKHMAAIDFLRRELESMQNEVAGAMPETSPGEQTRIHLQTSHPSVEELKERKHQRSISLSASQNSWHRSQALSDRQPQQPPGMPNIGTGQQHVFSIVDGLAMQPKKKRKMTPAERSAYKTTRKVGACDKCKRLKGRCTHVIKRNVPVGDTLQEDDIAFQRLDAPLPVMIAARNAEDPPHARKDTQDLSLSVTAPSSPQWAQETEEMQQGGQSEISGYVPSHATGVYPRPLHNSRETQWSNQTSFAEPQIFREDYDGYMSLPDQPDGTHAFSYPPDFYEQPWNQYAHYMSETKLG